ncbi:MAG: glycoside hydrolase N-terminal domain-containing protein, partial [Planctomycetota bacterium]
MQLGSKDKEETMEDKEIYRGPALLFAVMLLLLQPEIYACQVNGKFAGRENKMFFSRPGSRHEPETKAAESWDQAMPTGNGRVGALVFGNIQNETIVLNHDSLFITTQKPTL